MTKKEASYLLYYLNGMVKSEEFSIKYDVKEIFDAEDTGDAMRKAMHMVFFDNQVPLDIQYSFYWSGEICPTLNSFDR